MARVNEQLLGRINGKIGNLVFRNINGRTFVSRRPKKYNIKGTKESSKVKNGFKNLITFSSFVNSIPILHNLWGSKIIKGKRAYNKIFSHNKEHLKSAEINENFSITPQPVEFKIIIYNVNIEAGYVYLDFHSDYEPPSECFYHYVLVFYCLKQNKFVYQTGKLQNIEPGKRILINLPLEKQVVASLRSPGKMILFCAVIAADDSNFVLNWSNSKGTVYKQK